MCFGIISLFRVKKTAQGDSNENMKQKQVNTKQQQQQK